MVRCFAHRMSLPARAGQDSGTACMVNGTARVRGLACAGLGLGSLQQASEPARVSPTRPERLTQLDSYAREVYLQASEPVRVSGGAVTTLSRFDAASLGPALHRLHTRTTTHTTTHTPAFTHLCCSGVVAPLHH